MADDNRCRKVFSMIVCMVDGLNEVEWATVVKVEDQPALLACGLAAKVVLKDLIADELLEEIEAYTLPEVQDGE